MTFKKTTLMAVLLTLAFCLTACSNQTDEKVQTDTTADTASVETTAKTTETSAVTTSKTSEPAETAATLYELAESRKENRVYVEITDSTPFYSCKYEQTGLVSAENFADKALLEKAKAALLSSQVYTELYNEVKERMPDKEPAIKIDCSKVLAYDLDGSGSDEYAFLFCFSPDFDNADEEMLQNVWGAIDPNSPCAIVLCGDNGGFYTNDKKYAMNSELYILNYGSFAQFVVDGGVSNSSSCADYFSYYNGEFELELREFRKYEIRDEVFLLHSMAQASNAWLIFWDDDIKGYVTPEAVTVSREERDEIFDKLPLDEEEREFFKSFNICTIGDCFYSLYNNDLYSKTFIKDDNGDFVGFDTPFNFGINERKTPYYEPFEISYVKNLDYKNVLEKIKENQNAHIY